MGRWEPGASSRLREAAMALYIERGYEQTTVADIAERAGLTARTFFRYFTDKREVLFGGSHLLQDAMVQAVLAAPKPATPMDAVAAALDAAAGMIGGNRSYSRQRYQVIMANDELRERELIKMAALAAAVADALRRRGVREPKASLAAEAGVVVFRVAFERWVTGSGRSGLGKLLRESLTQLTGLTAAAPAS